MAYGKPALGLRMSNKRCDNKQEHEPRPVRNRPVVVILTTVPYTLNTFFRGQLAYLRDSGFEIHTVASTGPEWPEIVERERVETHQIPMTRTRLGVGDVRALIRLVRLFRNLRPDVVHTFTPKGGLLGLIAASLSGVPVRSNTIFGFVFASRRGAKRSLLRFFESLSCGLATTVYAESESIAQLAVSERVCALRKMKILPAWSLNSTREQLQAWSYREELRRSTRSRLNIPEGAFVFGYIGRLVPEKGTRELIDSFYSLDGDADVHLLLVGPQEVEHPLPEITRQKIRQHARIHKVGFQPKISPFLAAMDVLVHPSYREGLPSAPLESSAMGVPVITTDVPGCRDAVKHGYTGLLVPPANAQALVEAMRLLRVDEPLRARLGIQARSCVKNTMDVEKLWEQLAADYRAPLGGTQTAKSQLISSNT